MKETMIKRLFCVMIGLFGWAAFAVAQDTAPSRISHVTLFTNQALVTRTAEVQVNKGVNEIILAVDAFNVDSDSLSAKVFGQGELYSVQLKKVFLKDAPQENVKRLEQKLDELAALLAALENSKTVLSNQERFLNSLVDFSKTQLPQEIVTSFPKTEDLKNTLVFLERNYDQINLKRQDLKQKTKSVERDIEVVKKELAALSRQRKKRKNIIEIVFNANTDQRIRIEAGYLVQNAYWQPLYKATVPADLGPVNLTLFSKILQKSGEDWDNIDLSVSNVVPLRGSSLPKPFSWILDVERPAPKPYRSKGMVLDEAVVSQSTVDKEAGEFSGKAESPVPAEFVSAQKKELPLSFEYRMPRKLSIASRDKFTLLPLLTKNLSGDYVYYTVPKITPVAFLVCRTTADKEIMAGQMNVHFGSHFVGKTRLSEKKAGDVFDLNLGIDREIKVKREKVKDKIRETFFGKFERNTIVRDMAVKVMAENLKSKPVTIHVLESIPVSRTDKIKVEDIRMKPEPNERNYQNREGVMFWSFVVEPGGLKEVDISFTVSYPKNEPVRGL